MPTAATAQLTQIVSAQSDMGCNARSVEGTAYETQITASNPGPRSDATHAWERSGLGVAPYRLMGVATVTWRSVPEAPAQPGSSCDYCGQGISQVFSIRASCGSVFKVGCDCVRRVAAPGEKVLTDVEKAAKKHARELAAKRRARSSASTQDAFAVIREESADDLAALPHPAAWAAEQGKTALDWFDWMLAHCGAAGRAKLLKQTRALLGA